MISCSHNKDIDKLVMDVEANCVKNEDCIVDFSKEIDGDWDTMYFFSGANSLEDINMVLGFELKDFTDIGDRILFLKGNKIIYQKEWSFNNENNLKGIIFVPETIFFKYDKENCKFKILKNNEVYYLTKITPPPAAQSLPTLRKK